MRLVVNSDFNEFQRAKYFALTGIIKLMKICLKTRYKAGSIG